MSKYRLSNEAKNDLILLHQYGVKKFGMAQEDKYFETFFEYFDIIAQRAFSFESVDNIKKITDVAFVELIVFILKLMKIW